MVCGAVLCINRHVWRMLVREGEVAERRGDYPLPGSPGKMAPIDGNMYRLAEYVERHQNLRIQILSCKQTSGSNQQAPKTNKLAPSVKGETMAQRCLNGLVLSQNTQLRSGL